MLLGEARHDIFILERKLWSFFLALCSLLFIFAERTIKFYEVISICSTSDAHKFPSNDHEKSIWKNAIKIIRTWQVLWFFFYRQFKEHPFFKWPRCFLKFLTKKLLSQLILTCERQISKRFHPECQ